MTADCQAQDCRCGCHVPLAVRLEAIGLSLDSLTATELALVDALLPPDEWRSPERLGAAVGWDVEDMAQRRHLLRVNVARIRPVLHAAGWDVLALNGTGCYRIQACTADVAAQCPRAPRYIAPRGVCIDCGGLRERLNKRSSTRRCDACLTKFRAAQPVHAGVPRCERCGDLLHTRTTTACKACRWQFGLGQRCEDCAAPISPNATRCRSCAARESMLRLRACDRVAV